MANRDRSDPATRQPAKQPETEVEKVQALESEVRRLKQSLLERLMRVEQNTRRFLRRHPAGPWRKPAREILRLIPIARIKEMSGQPDPEILEIRELDALMWRLRITPLVVRGLRFQSGGKAGRMDALSRTLAEILKDDPRRAGKDMWGDLEQLVKGRTHPVVLKVDGNLLHWKPGPGRRTRTTTRKALLNRLPRLRRLLRPK